MSLELKSRAAKGLLWGGLNNGMVQFLGMLFGILMLRKLNPGDQGKMEMLLVFANIASTLQESGFTAALCNLKTPTHRDYNAVFWFNVGMGTLLYCILFCCAPLIADFYGDPDLLPLSRYVFLGFLFSSLGTAQRAYLFINLMNKQSCVIAITSLVVSNVTGLVLAYMGFAYWALATQNLLFILVVALMNWYYSPWRPSFHIDLRPAWQMFGFGSKLLLTNIVNVVSSNAFSFLLGKFYGDYQAGIYGNARKWNNMCANTINGMLTGVAQPVLVQASKEQPGTVSAPASPAILPVFRKMLRFISFVSFPCLLGIGLIAREFLLVTVGEKWLQSAELLSMLSIYGAIFPLLTLYSQMTISQGRSNINMWCTVCLSAFILTGLVALYPYGLRVMVVYFVAINLAWLFVWQYFAWRLIRLTLWQALSDVLPFALTAASAMAFTAWATQPIGNIYLLLAGKVALAAVLYVGVIWLSGARIMRESIAFLLPGLSRRYRFLQP